MTVKLLGEFPQGSYVQWIKDEDTPTIPGVRDRAVGLIIEVVDEETAVIDWPSARKHRHKFEIGDLRKYRNRAALESFYPTEERTIVQDLISK